MCLAEMLSLLLWHALPQALCRPGQPTAVALGDRCPPLAVCTQRTCTADDTGAEGYTVACCALHRMSRAPTPAHALVRSLLLTTPQNGILGDIALVWHERTASAAATGRGAS